MKSRICAVVLASTLIVAGCGSDSEKAEVPERTNAPPTSPTSPPSASETPTSVASPTSAVDSPTSVSDTPTGQPVRVVVIIDENEAAGYTNKPLRNGLAAAVDGVNNRGGIGGRPLEVTVCDAGFTAQGAERCARDAADDPTVVAVVGSANNEGDTIMPILEAAGLPALGSFPLTAADFTSPMAFPLISGSVSAAGTGTLALDLVGGADIAVATLDVPGGKQGEALLGAALAARGATARPAVAIPIDKPDLAAEAAQLSESADVILPLLDSATFSRLFAALRQLGSSVPIVACSACAPNVALKALGAGDNVYIAAGIAFGDMEGEWVELSTLEINERDADAGLDDNARNAWLAVNVLVAIAGDLAEIDRASVVEALEQTSNLDTHGLTPTIDFTSTPTALGGALPRLFNPTVVYGRWTGEELVVITGEFVDPFAAAE